jgi:hypothetical protein
MGQRHGQTRCATRARARSGGRGPRVSDLEREGERIGTGRLSGGAHRLGSPLASVVCTARVPWPEPVATRGQRRAWGDGGWLESPGTTERCCCR